MIDKIILFHQSDFRQFYRIAGLTKRLGDDLTSIVEFTQGLTYTNWPI